MRSIDFMILRCEYKDRPIYERHPHLCHALALFLIPTILAACSGSRGPGRSAGLPPLDPEQVQHGSVIYAANCAACHGVEAEGQPNWKTPDANGSYPVPPHDASGHTWHHGDGTLFQIVEGGGASLNIPGFKSNMPAFGEALSDEDIIAVLTYIKSLWPAEQRRNQVEVSQQDPWPP